MRRLFWVLGLVVLSGATAMAAPSDITSRNTSRYLGDGQWEWTVFLEGPEADLDRIRRVEYLLHPSFEPRRVQSRERQTPQGPFAITRVGWGTFQIPITVTFTDGTQWSLTHRLSFAGSRAESSPMSIRLDNDAQQLGRSLWSWTAFIEGPEDTLSQIQCVVYTLHETFPDPVREVCEQGEGPHAFSLSATGWGSFRLRARVYFKDGRIQDLAHELRF
jgi:transcription initiation factor IIF auxiliary subunit